MKMILFYAPEFWFKPYAAALPEPVSGEPTQEATKSDATHATGEDQPGPAGQPEQPEQPGQREQEDQEEELLREAVVVFYQMEAHDQERRGPITTKTVKNVKWLACKWDTRTVLLHSFGHLSASKAPPEFAAEVMAEVRQRLERAGYAVHETPFGWLNEWKMHVAGPSLAKVFKDL